MYRFLLSVSLVITFLLFVIIGAFFSKFMGHFVTLLAAGLLLIDFIVILSTKKK